LANARTGARGRIDGVRQHIRGRGGHGADSAPHGSHQNGMRTRAEPAKKGRRQAFRGEHGGLETIYGAIGWLSFMPPAEDPALWAGSHMRALRKQASSRCGGKLYPETAGLLVILAHSFAHQKAQQRCHGRSLPFDPLLPFRRSRQISAVQR